MVSNIANIVVRVPKPRICCLEFSFDDVYKETSATSAKGDE